MKGNPSQNRPAGAIDREWTQEELRAYLEPHGFAFLEGEVIPQGCKFISFELATEADMRSAKELLERLLRGAEEA